VLIHTCWLVNNHITVRLHARYQHARWLLRRYTIPSLLTGGLMLSIYVFYHWSTWLLLLLICAVMSSITCRRLLDTARLAKVQTRPLATTAFAQEQEDVSLKAQTPQAQTLGDFPATPMPATPLIRVLDTIDLSSSGVQHFIRSTADYKPAAKHPTSTPMPEEQAHHDRML
jgi:hypothetical protein